MPNPLARSALAQHSRSPSILEKRECVGTGLPNTATALDFSSPLFQAHRQRQRCPNITTAKTTAGNKQKWQKSFPWRNQSHRHEAESGRKTWSRYRHTHKINKQKIHTNAKPEAFSILSSKIKFLYPSMPNKFCSQRTRGKKKKGNKSLDKCWKSRELTLTPSPA